eukprot:m.145771 g.145771  ORF g.145771 m.145771 type:complete len:578 (+) comp38432_c1_seq17:136-1869(+)
MASGNLYAVFNDSSPQRLERVGPPPQLDSQTDEAKFAVNFPTSSKFEEIDHIVVYEKRNFSDSDIPETTHQQSWKADLQLQTYTRTLKEQVRISEAGPAIVVPLDEWTSKEKMKVGRGIEAKLVVTTTNEQKANPDGHAYAETRSDLSVHHVPDVHVSSTHAPISNREGLDSRKRPLESAVQELAEKRPKVKIVPTGRTGHAMCVISEDTAVMVGGEMKTNPGDEYAFHNDDSFYQLKLVENEGSYDVQWTKVAVESTKDAEKSKRIGHQIIYHNGKKEVSLVGGFKYYSTVKRKRNEREGLLLQRDKGELVKPATMPLFSAPSLEKTDYPGNWRSRKTKGSGKSMFCHTAVVHQRQIITFGGITSSLAGNAESPMAKLPLGRMRTDDYIEEFYSYSIDSNKWEQLEIYRDVNEVPIKRARHSMVLIDQKIYIFGGTKNTEIKSQYSGFQPSESSIIKELFNELHILDLEGKTLARHLPSGRESPPKRYNHAACLLPDKTMFIHGGVGSNEAVLNDAYKLETSPLCWRKVKHDKLLPRSGHSAIVLGNNVVLFGGLASDLTFTNDTIVFDYRNLADV